MTTRHSGKIKMWNHERAFGFITPDDPDSDDVFCHVTSLPDESLMNIGDKVSYELRDDSRGRGKQAANVDA